MDYWSSDSSPAAELVLTEAVLQTMTVEDLSIHALFWQQKLSYVVYGQPLAGLDNDFCVMYLEKAFDVLLTSSSIELGPRCLFLMVLIKFSVHLMSCKELRHLPLILRALTGSYVASGTKLWRNGVLNLITKLCWTSTWVPHDDSAPFVEELRMFGCVIDNIAGNFDSHDVVASYFGMTCGLLVLRRLIGDESVKNLDDFVTAFEILEAMVPFMSSEYQTYFGGQMRSILQAPAKEAGLREKFGSLGGMKGLGALIRLSKGTRHEDFFLEYYVTTLMRLAKGEEKHEVVVGELQHCQQLSKEGKLVAILREEFMNMVSLTGNNPWVAQYVRLLEPIVHGSYEPRDLFARVENDPQCIGVVFDWIKEVVPNSVIQKLLSQNTDVNEGNAELLINCLVVVEDANEEDLVAAIRGLLRLSSKGVFQRLRTDVVGQDRLKGPMLKAIQQLNSEQANVDLYNMCELLKLLGVDDFGINNIEEKLFLERDSVEIIDFVVQYPFVRIDDVSLLVEFAPHDDTLFSVLRERFLDSLVTCVEDIVGICSASSQFYRLLVDGFKQTKEIKLALKALTIKTEDSAELLGSIQQVVNEKSSMIVDDIIFAVEKWGDAIMPFIKQLDLSMLQFPNTASTNDVLMAFKADMGVGDSASVLSLLDSSPSMYARTVAFDRLIAAPQDNNSSQTIDSLYAYGLENGGYDLLAKMTQAQAPFTIEQKLCERMCLADKQSAKLIFDRLMELREIDFVKDFVKPLLESKNLEVVANLFTNREIFDGFKALIQRKDYSESFSEFGDFLNCIRLPDDDITYAIFQYFLSSDFPCFLRDSVTISLIFGWLGKSRNVAMKILKEFCDVNTTNVCEVCPAAESPFLMLLAHLDVLFDTEPANVQECLAKIRFSSAQHVKKPQSFMCDRWNAVLNSLSLASRKRFEVVIEKGTQVSTANWVSLAIKNGIIESMRENSIVIRSQPDVLVFQVTNIVGSSIECELEINEGQYKLVGIGASNSSSYLRTGNGWIKCTPSSCTEVDDLSELPNLVVYQKSHLRPRNIPVRLTADDVFARCLHDVSVNWAAFYGETEQENTEFFSVMLNLLNKWPSTQAFTALAKCQGFLEALLYGEEPFAFSALSSRIYEKSLVTAISQIDPFNAVVQLLQFPERRDWINIAIWVMAGDSLTLDQKLSIMKDDFSTRIKRSVTAGSYRALLESVIMDPSFSEEQLGNDILVDAIKADVPVILNRLMPLNESLWDDFLATCSVSHLTQTLRRHLECGGQETLVLRAVNKHPGYQELIPFILNIQNKEVLKGSKAWISLILTSSNTKLREQGMHLVEQLWPPALEETDYELARIFCECLEKTRAFIEFYPLVSKYFKWFGNYQEITKLYLEFLWSRAPCNVPHFRDIVVTICKLPVPSVESFAELLRAYLQCDFADRLFHWSVLMLCARMCSELKSFSSLGITERGLANFSACLLAHHGTEEDLKQIADMFVSNIAPQKLASSVKFVAVFCPARRVIAPYMKQLLVAKDKCDLLTLLIYIRAVLVLFTRKPVDGVSLPNSEEADLAILDDLCNALPTSFARVPLQPDEQEQVAHIRRMFTASNWGVKYPTDAKDVRIKYTFLRLIKVISSLCDELSVAVAQFYCNNPPFCFHSNDHGFREAYCKFLVDTFAKSTEDTFSEAYRDWGGVIFKDGMTNVFRLPDLHLSSVFPVIEYIEKLLTNPGDKEWLQASVKSRISKLPSLFLLPMCVIAPGRELRLVLRFFTNLFKLTTPDLSELDVFVNSLQAGDTNRLKLLLHILKQYINTQLTTNNTGYNSVARSMPHIEMLIAERPSQDLTDILDQMIVILTASLQ